MNRYIPLIITGVFLNAMAQLALKQGMRTIGEFSFSFQTIIPTGFKVLTNGYILGGFACYGISVFLWLLVLSRVDVSYAYPFLSIGYIITATAGYFFFNEPMGLLKSAGFVFICLGLYLITRTA